MLVISKLGFLGASKIRQSSEASREDLKLQAYTKSKAQQIHKIQNTIPKSKNPKFQTSKNPQIQNSQIPKNQTFLRDSVDVKIFGCLDFFEFGSLGILDFWILGFLAFGIFGFLDFGFLDFCILGSLTFLVLLFDRNAASQTEPNSGQQKSGFRTG